MELMEAIHGRRSIRKFTDEPIPREVLEEIMEAASWAPSGQNLQPWYLLALTQDADLAWVFSELGTGAFSHRKHLEARFKNNPEVVEETMEFMRAMGGARTIVLAFLQKPTYSEQDMPSCIESVAAAMQTLCLAAYDKGVASCWVEEFKRIDEQARERFCPDKGALLGGVVLGYPAMEARPIRRKPGRIEIR
jgi:nitroreductase